MNMLVDGEWRVDDYESTDEEGEFDRQETSFRSRIEDDPDAEFPAEAGRYHLYVSYACPWAHRTLLVRSLKGLEDAISVSVVDPHRVNDGWEFTPEKEGCTEDRVNGFDYLREVYTKADPEFTGRVTVPVLWDTERETVVNNESKEIMRMLDTGFGTGEARRASDASGDTASAERDVTLYPEGYREEVDDRIEDIYDPINNGVYRAGFAGNQAAYERAVGELFDALDRYDDLLADRRYLAGPVLTEADVAMFTTLVRFDAVYHTHFKCNVRQISDYENLWPYLRDLYQTEGVAETVHLDHITEHYYRSHTDLNPKGIVPAGPDLDFEEPHDRDELPGEPPEGLDAVAR
ncbi:glutathione S-transferase family protein (plasmid) [Halorussus salilacus]|uniref:glutathione S-transferase family protein n=1 Tax=Halorussus salilacus TaxID=2953750 RepID=UPI00209D2464|nr:glutathione S-transferase family protein [Halorussus salilacus]USZ69853.1 glutathione S-transferase family protein [Halorussus salilacus]